MLRFSRAVITLGGMCILPASRNRLLQSCICDSRLHSRTFQSCELTASNVSDVIDGYDTILLDCDGVMWRTDHVTRIPGVTQAVSALQQMGKQLFFVTNNSLHARNMFLDKFEAHGITTNIDRILTASYATALYLKHVANINGSVYIIAKQGMKEELNDLGINNFGSGPDLDSPSADPEELLKMHFRSNVQAVVVGFDECFSYNKIYKAASYLTNEKCLYLVTNSLETGVLLAPDRRQPTTGTLVAAVSAACRREPTVIGKPTPYMFECLRRVHPEVEKRKTLMIGDSLRADIGFAKQCGIDSALVLTGASSLEDINKNPNLEPTYFMQSLATLCHLRDR